MQDGLVIFLQALTNGYFVTAPKIAQPLFDKILLREQSAGMPLKFTERFVAQDGLDPVAVIVEAEERLETQAAAIGAEEKTLNPILPLQGDIVAGKLVDHHQEAVTVAPHLRTAAATARIAPALFAYSGHHKFRHEPHQKICPGLKLCQGSDDLSIRQDRLPVDFQPRFGAGHAFFEAREPGGGNCPGKRTPQVIIGAIHPAGP
jgi:hypothetical protein